MRLKVKRLNKDAKLPAYGTKGDAGMDFFSIIDVVVPPKHRAIIPTGIAMEIPYGYVGLVWDKGGMGQKKGLKILGGVVDAGYRGEIQIGLVNLSGSPFKIEKGMKVAQMLIQKVELVDIVEAKKLSSSERGKGKWGSTGK